MNDLMRLPLGILTGVGFIGGGAILRRDSLVIGVTTAATLWYVTVIGLCFGGGQFGLGAAATLLGLLTLWVLKWFEDGLRRERIVHLTIVIGENGPSVDAIVQRLRQAGLTIVKQSVAWAANDRRRDVTFEVRELSYPGVMVTPRVIVELEKEPGIEKLAWSIPA
jgi:putative Mg2+ transporter-C (MgtC) family protein